MLFRSLLSCVAMCEVIDHPDVKCQVKSKGMQRNGMLAASQTDSLHVNMCDIVCVGLKLSKSLYWFQTRPLIASVPGPETVKEGRSLRSTLWSPTISC